MSSMGGDEAVTLQSGDNEVFSVSKEVACQASLIKEMLADTESDVVIPLPNVEGPILSKMIEYCTWHVGAEADGASDNRHQRTPRTTIAQSSWTRSTKGPSAA